VGVLSPQARRRPPAPPISASARLSAASMWSLAPMTTDDELDDEILFDDQIDRLSRYRFNCSNELKQIICELIAIKGRKDKEDIR
jgi:hypothetical protein